jgi:Phosphoenolpyruvate phosphomutase
MEQTQRARAFAELHKPGQPLLLPNAWDVASAVAIADAGAKAIATTSAGVAWSLGVPDGAGLGAERAAAVIARIVAALDVPMSADIEAGYEDVAATVAAVLQAGRSASTSKIAATDLGSTSRPSKPTGWPPHARQLAASGSGSTLAPTYSSPAPAGSMTRLSGPPPMRRRVRTACSCQAWSTRRRSPSWRRGRCRSR